VAARPGGCDDDVDSNHGRRLLFQSGEDNTRTYTVALSVSVSIYVNSFNSIIALSVCISLADAISISITIIVSVTIPISFAISRVQNQRASDGCKSASQRSQNHDRGIKDFIDDNRCKWLLHFQ
jgi:hypothetical protein